MGGLKRHERLAQGQVLRDIEDTTSAMAPSINADAQSLGQSGGVSGGLDRRAPRPVHTEMWPTRCHSGVAGDDELARAAGDVVVLYTSRVPVAKRRAGTRHRLGAIGDSRPPPSERTVDLQVAASAAVRPRGTISPSLDRDDVAGNQMPGGESPPAGRTAITWP